MHPISPTRALKPVLGFSVLQRGCKISVENLKPHSTLFPCSLAGVVGHFYLQEDRDRVVNKVPVLCMGHLGLPIVQTFQITRVKALRGMAARDKDCVELFAYCNLNITAP